MKKPKPPEKAHDNGRLSCWQRAPIDWQDLAMNALMMDMAVLAPNAPTCSPFRSCAPGGQSHNDLYGPPDLYQPAASRSGPANEVQHVPAHRPCTRSVPRRQGLATRRAARRYRIEEAWLKSLVATPAAMLSTIRFLSWQLARRKFRLRLK